MKVKHTQMKKQIYGILGLILLVLIVTISCGKSNGYGSTAASNYSVNIANMAFSPASYSVKAGITVTWTNNDNMTHTVTANDSSFYSGNITVGSSYSKTFSVAGTCPYHCTIHPGMKGTIVVTP
jgi:plastocyanin